MNANSMIYSRHDYRDVRHVYTRNGHGAKTRVRVRVKSRFRFIAFLIIVIGLTMGTLGFITGMNDSTASVVTDYTTYTAGAGDTIWSIAEHMNYDNIDTRQAVYTICQLNDLQPEELQPGMVLTVPAE